MAMPMLDMLTVEMLSMIMLPAPKGPIPPGMKVTSIQGPDSLQPMPACPVLAVGGFTLWPMSYIDNRVSFGMVMYGLNWEIVSTVEKPGARYIYNITMTGTGIIGNVTFWGQANQSVNMSLQEICDMMCTPDVS